MDVVLSNADRSRALKAGRGMAERSRAMRSRSATDGSAGTKSRFASMSVTARSSCSKLVCLLMSATCLRPQILQCPELKLLDGAFGSAEVLCDIANAFLFDETLNDDGALIFRKAVYQLKQCGAPLDLRPVRLIEIVQRCRVVVVIR